MGHTFSNLLVHVIFSTKNRQPTIVAVLREKLYGYMAGVANGEVMMANSSHLWTTPGAR